MNQQLKQLHKWIYYWVFEEQTKKTFSSIILFVLLMLSLIFNFLLIGLLHCKLSTNMVLSLFCPKLTGNIDMAHVVLM